MKKYFFCVLEQVKRVIPTLIRLVVTYGILSLVNSDLLKTSVEVLLLLEGI